MTATLAKGSETKTVRTLFRARSTKFSDNVHRKAELICAEILKKLEFEEIFELELTRPKTFEVETIPLSTFMNSQSNRIRYQIG